MTVLRALDVLLVQAPLWPWRGPRGLRPTRCSRCWPRWRPLRGRPRGQRRHRGSELQRRCQPLLRAGSRPLAALCRRSEGLARMLPRHLPSLPGSGRFGAGGRRCVSLPVSRSSTRTAGPLSYPTPSARHPFHQWRRRFPVLRTAPCGALLPQRFAWRVPLPSHGPPLPLPPLPVRRMHCRRPIPPTWTGRGRFRCRGSDAARGPRWACRP